jgi:hypothetical protein
MEILYQLIFTLLALVLVIVAAYVGGRARMLRYPELRFWLYIPDATIPGYGWKVIRVNTAYLKLTTTPLTPSATLMQGAIQYEHWAEALNNKPLNGYGKSGGEHQAARLLNPYEWCLGVDYYTGPYVFSDRPLNPSELESLQDAAARLLLP